MNPDSYQDHSYMFLPLLIINGKVVSRGAVLNEREILNIINRILPAGQRVADEQKPKDKSALRQYIRWPLLLAVGAAIVFLTRWFSPGSDRQEPVRYYGFVTNNCEDCDRMVQVADSIRVAFRNEVEVKVSDVRDSASANLCDWFNISLVPAQVITGRDGKVIFRHTGYLRADSMMSVIRKELDD